METPLSERRITRSHMSKKIEGMDDKGVQKTGKHQDRSALIDITNDSPIVGLAMGNLGTPSSDFSKKRNVMITMNWETCDSGEALLRGQVKTLLQKVEEEAQLSNFSLDNNGGPFVNSPMPLLAPTPINNTPLVSLNQSQSVSITSPPVLQQVSITKMVTQIIDRQKKEEESSITRSLIFDFSDKSSDSSDFISGLTFQGESKVKPNMDDDDDSSIWSIQANASTKAKEEDDDDVEDEEVDYDYDLEDFDYDDEALYDLCEDLSKIDVNGTTDFSGKHTRFCYNSDDKTIENEDSSTGVLMLKGLPST